MYQRLFIFIFGFLSLVYSTKYETSFMQYSVPMATIKAFQSKGFSVSIPNSPGLSLFAFHGNINSKLELLEGGMISKDILQPENGMWIYKETSIKLEVGDIINYWLYVERDGLGYRRDLQQFVVKELYNDDSLTKVAEDVVMENSDFNIKHEQSTILSGDIHHYHHYYNDSTSTSSQCQSEMKSNEFFESISKQLNVVLIQLQSLHDKISPLKNKIDSLEEVIGALLKDKDNGTKLLLIGTSPPHDSNAYESIRGVITDRLDLHDLSSAIKFAEIVQGGIMFEVKNSIEKHRILIRAQERFNTDKNKIVDFSEKSTANSQIPEIYYRTGTEKIVEVAQTDNSDRFLFE